METAVVPLFVFLYNSSNKKTVAIAEDKKKIVDLERAITKRERDAQHAAMENRVCGLEAEFRNEMKRMGMELRHKDDEINQTLASFKHTFDRIFAKLEKIEDKLHEQRKGG